MKYNSLLLFGTLLSASVVSGNDLINQRSSDMKSNIHISENEIDYFG